MTIETEITEIKRFCNICRKELNHITEINIDVHENCMSEVIGACADCHLPGPVYATLGKMVCDSCFQSTENQEARLMVSRANQESARQIDNAISVRTDLFNAATVAIQSLKENIDLDTGIINKPYALAEQLKNRFEHFKSVVFDLNEKLVAAGNEQKAIQIYLNNLANTLRAEEREKLKIADINYKPNVVKPIKPTAIKTAKGKFNKAEISKYAKELGVAEFTLQMLVVSKGITPEAAANMLRKSINEAKSES
jgi:hypothetical protein